MDTKGPFLKNLFKCGYGYTTPSTKVLKESSKKQTCQTGSANFIIAQLPWWENFWPTLLPMFWGFYEWIEFKKMLTVISRDNLSNFFD